MMKSLLFGFYASSRMFSEEDEYTIRVDNASHFSARHHTKLLLYRSIKPLPPKYEFFRSGN